MLSLRQPSPALCALTPFGRPDLALTLAALRAEREVCLDVSCGLEREAWPGAPLASELLNALLNACERDLARGPQATLAPSTRPSLRLSSEVSLSALTTLLAGRTHLIERLILPAERLLGGSDEERGEELSAWRTLALPLWLEVYTRDDLEPALMLTDPLVTGLVLTGSEAAGRVGEVGAFLTLQRALKLRAEAPFKALRERELILRGGVSVTTGAAALALGADRLLLDEHLALCDELSAPSSLTRLLPRLEPSHSTLNNSALAGNTRLLSHPSLPSELSAGGGHEVPASPDLGQLSLSSAHRGVVGALSALEEALSAHLQAIQALSAAPQPAPLTLAQGPMTRVSDSPAFALAVAEAGALPFLALSLLTPERAEALMSETRKLLGDLPWGVGVLGFAPPELREAHLELIKRFKPSAALIAGGRPAQARPLEEVGVPTYLHSPSPALTRAFLKAGVRRLIFEGAECGGHIGPSTSFSLWSAQLKAVEEALEEGDVRDASELSLWWAGGVHDATSAALVRAMSAPLTLKGTEQGVVMGTAYLFTEEAVRSGAILEEYQRVALSCERTATLHTAPGHATRCAPSPFVQEFQERSEALEREGVPSRERWAALEQLNVGRLRAASKGLEREGGELKPLSLEAQRARGMYMIGEVATLRARVTTASELHKEVREGSHERLTRSLQHAQARPHLIPLLGETMTSHAQPHPQASPYTHPQGDAIAIVGLSCLFPQASDHEAYWSLILNGLDAVTEVPDERWPKDLYYDPEAPAGEKSASKWGAFLEPLPLEPARYGLPPTTLSAVEPVQLLALEVAARALNDAGYAPLKGEEGRDFNRSRASVIFGAEAGTDLANAYSLRGTLPQWVGALTPELSERLPQLTEDSFAGVLANVIAGRVANRLDLGGANFTVDAACASSLAALDAAVKQLKLHEADLVICGGADLHNSVNDYLMFSSVHALSKTGRCKPFDQSADGITLGEGVAALTLKRLSDAQRDGDRVYAVIEGVGASSDGRHFGLTAPRKEGQQRALERAYERAGVSPAQIGLVEAHGTGTVVGDKTELSALTETYLQAGAAPRSVALGSVKSQIGHTKCAAGMAGLIKVALSIYKRTLTPTLHIKAPNKAYEASESPFVFYERPQPWLSEARWGAVSAFGFGGTNFHATLREAPQSPAPTHLRGAWAQEPLVLWAPSAQALRERAARWLNALNARLALIEAGGVPTQAELRDLAFGLWRDGSEALLQGARRPQVGAVALVSDWEEAREALAWIAQAETSEGSPESSPPQSVVSAWGLNPSEEPHQAEPWRAREEVAALFPGQGAQRVGMMSELALTFGVVADRWLKHAKWSRHISPPPPRDAQERKAQTATLTDTRNAQPALGVCDLSMWSLLRGLGFEARHLAGHSYGELVALSVAGAIPRDQLAPLSAARGEAILGAAQGGDVGAMAAMKAGQTELSEALSALQAEDPSLEGVVIANLNAPQQSVISGPTEAVKRAVELLKGRSIRGKSIPVACAFHSAVVAQGGPTFEATLNERGLNALTDDEGYVVWSNERAAPYPTPLKGEEVATALSCHIASPVRFVEQIEAMYAAGARLFVEVGPGRILSKLVGDILGERPHEVTSCAPQTGSVAELLTALAQLSALGVAVQWGALFEERAHPLTPEALGAPHPAKLLWWVNGQRAWPVKGELTRGLRPPTSPLGWYDPHVSALPPASRALDAAHLLPPASELASELPQERSTLMSHPSPPITPSPSTPSAPAMSPSGALNEALSAYFENMRALAASQQQVMLALMGQGAPSLTSISPPSVVTPSPVVPTPSVTIPSPAQAPVDDWWASALAPAPAPAPQAAPMPQATPKPAPQAEPASQAQATLESVPAPQAPPQDVGALLVALVSERTGYPTEMLDPTLDLEADLGVDSIKRIEILGALGERLGLAQDGEGEAMVEELAMMKSLGEMTSWLHTKLSTSSATPSEVSSKESLEEGERPKAEGEGLPRAQRVWVASPLNCTTNTHELSELSELAVERLERALDEPFTLIPLSGEGEAREELLVMPSYAHVRTEPSSLPLILLTLLQRAWLAESTTPPLSLLVVAPHPRDTREALALGGLNGFIKTLWRELPTLKVRLVWLDEPKAGSLRGDVWREAIILEWRSLNAQERAELPIISRWSAEEGGALTRYVERYEPRALSTLSSALSTAPQNPTPSVQQGALLVTGGARGITAHCVRALPHLKGRLVLLCGRSPAPTHRSELWARCEASLEALSDELWTGEERALKRALAEALPELERAELGALIKEGRARREISEQLSVLEERGARARYLSVDVSDTEALAQAVHEALREASREGEREGEPPLQVTEVLHGAGVIEDKKLKDKRPESFERVWRVKVEGARALLSVAPHAQRWVFFSSVSSALGNQGQVDYASANAALDALAEALCAEGRDASALQWGPWGGAGMVSDVLARYYARAGVRLIELEQGLEAFVAEWAATSSAREACVTLRSWPFER